MSFPSGSGGTVMRESAGGSGGGGVIGAPGTGGDQTGDNPSVETTLTADTFTRTIALGSVSWGTSSSGATWSRQSGTWSVDGAAGLNHTAGIMRMTTSGMSARMQLLVVANVVIIRGRFRYQTLPTGNGSGRNGYATPKIEFSGNSLLRAAWYAQFVQDVDGGNSIQPEWGVIRINNTTTTHNSHISTSWTANQWYYFGLKIDRNLLTISGGMDTVPVTSFPAVITGQSVPISFVRLDYAPTYTAGTVSSPPISEYDDLDISGSAT